MILIGVKMHSFELKSELLHHKLIRNVTVLSVVRDSSLFIICDKRKKRNPFAINISSMFFFT